MMSYASQRSDPYVKHQDSFDSALLVTDPSHNSRRWQAQAVRTPFTSLGDTETDHIVGVLQYIGDISNLFVGLNEKK